jgi:hypothetical protein
MNIYTNGYAIAGVTAGKVAGLIERIALAGNAITLTDFVHGSPYNEWMGRDVEVKDFERGIYMDTEYKLEETQLAAISRLSNGVLSLFYYGNMSGYGCSYFLDGKKVLDRVTVLGNNLTDEDNGQEFTGHATPQLIERLFQLLTGAELRIAVQTKGTMYLININNKQP